MIHLLMAHPGHHFDPDTLSAIPPFFCRVLRLPWRKQAAAVPFDDRFPCCAHCGDDYGYPCDPRDMHLAPCQDGCSEPVLGGRMISEVRAEYDERVLSDAERTALFATRRARQHADAMHAGYARAVDRLRADAGLPTVEEMRAEYFALPKREPMRREPGKPPWHTMARPVYGQACVADVLAAGQEGRLIA